MTTGEAKALMADATKASGDGVQFYLGGDAVDLAETPYGGASNGIGVGAADSAAGRGPLPASGSRS